MTNSNSQQSQPSVRSEHRGPRVAVELVFTSNARRQ